MELKREVAGTSKIEGADFTDRELDEALTGTIQSRRIAAEMAAIRLRPPYELCRDHETSSIQPYRDMI
jgi:hypothetical protein